MDSDTRAILRRTELEVLKSFPDLFLFHPIAYFMVKLPIVHILSRFPLLLFNF